ncbi:penicillin-binding protein [Ktedonobacteria bacterium brp13]|nr:penicillin-binding protein [Ktedonobacteria bacterium brp13]
MVTRNNRVWPTENWSESFPEERGLNSKFLVAMDQYVQREDSKFRAILVIQHGKLVFERYYEELEPYHYHRIASATKSIISMLIGIALKENYLRSLDQTLVSFFPEYASSITDMDKQAITLRHLLTMTSGLAYDEFKDYVVRWDEGGDQWAEFALSLPMAHKPGEVFQYASLGVHLLSIILTKVTGKSTLDFARHYLFNPLGIATNEQDGFLWMRDPQGYYRGGGGMRLAARDCARLGYLYLNGGQWEDKQLFSPEYHALTTQQANAGGPPVQETYGYLWWVTNYLGYHTYFASGIGGQIIAVVPELDLVVVILSANQHNPKERLQREIIPQFIIPASMDKER